MGALPRATTRARRRAFALALLAAALCPPACSREAPPEATAPPRHAVLLVIDTLRGDALVHARTPTLDSLAMRGVSVPRAWSSGTWTAPSLVSLFTGMHVRQHGWDFGFRGRRSERGRMYPPLPPAPTLGEVLHESGFETAGIFASRVLRWPLGFDRGFDRWQKTVDEELPGLVADEVAGWNDGRRHFLYLHLMGPHQPLRPSVEAIRRWGLEEEALAHPAGFDQHEVRRLRGEAWKQAKDVYRRAYHAVVEDTDARVAEILGPLAPYFDETLLVVTADHGEMLGEHFHLGHRTWVYERLTHIPLIAVHAGPLPEALTLAAVPHLITRGLGIEHPWPVRVDDGGPLVSQRQGRLALSAQGRLRGMWKQRRRQPVLVFDAMEDPDEWTPLEGREAELQALRREFEARVPRGFIHEEAVPLSGEMVDELKALGYLDPDDS